MGLDKVLTSDPPPPPGAGPPPPPSNSVICNGEVEDDSDLKANVKQIDKRNIREVITQPYLYSGEDVLSTPFDGLTSLKPMTLLSSYPSFHDVALLPY